MLTVSIFPPASQPCFPQPDLAAQEARRAKRAAAREARKSAASSSQTLQGDRERLEKVMQTPPAEAISRTDTTRRSSSAATRGPVDERMGQQSLVLAAGPSLLGPSLLYVPSVGRHQQAAPSDIAREANAKRARLNGKGRTAVAGSVNGLVRSSSRSSQSSDGTTMFMKVGGAASSARPLHAVFSISGA